MGSLADIIRAHHLQWGSGHRDLRGGEVGMVWVGMALRDAGYDVQLATRHATLIQAMGEQAGREGEHDLLALVVGDTLIGPEGEDHWDAISRQSCRRSGIWRHGAMKDRSRLIAFETSWVVETDMFERVDPSIMAGAREAVAMIVSQAQAQALQDCTPLTADKARGPRF